MFFQETKGYTTNLFVGILTKTTAFVQNLLNIVGEDSRSGIGDGSVRGEVTACGQHVPILNEGRLKTINGT